MQAEIILCIPHLCLARVLPTATGLVLVAYAVMMVLLINFPKWLELFVKRYQTATEMCSISVHSFSCSIITTVKPPWVDIEEIIDTWTYRIMEQIYDGDHHSTAIRGKFITIFQLCLYYQILSNIFKQTQY